MDQTPSDDGPQNGNDQSGNDQNGNDQHGNDQHGNDQHGNDHNDDGARDDGPRDPFAEMLARLGLGGPGGQVDLQAVMAQLQQLMGQGFPGAAAGAGAGAASGVGFTFPGMPGAAGASAGVNWSQARNATRQLSAGAGPDPSPTAAQQRALNDSARLAELWLDEVCEFAAVPTTPQVWSRAEWIEHTLDSWRPIVEPIVSSLGEAMSELLVPEAGEDDPMAGLAAMFAPMLRQMAAGMYTMQFSQALAELSQEVVSGAEIGVQLLPLARVTLVESNIAAHFGEFGLPDGDVRLYLTLREAARQRLFNAVGWLGPQLLALIEHYARETRIDRAAIESAIEVDDLQSLSPAKLQELSSQLQGKLFDPTKTDEQRAVLQRLETLLALTEGWVDHVVATASARWMPNHAALAETVRRRRGAGGPTEKVFQALVGLELRPRRVRDAQNLWAAVESSQGALERDALWSHPDLLPTSDDLDDPLGFSSGEGAKLLEAPTQTGDDLDAELAKLLDQERGQD